MTDGLASYTLPNRQFIELADGVRLAYLEKGQGTDIVLIHGTLTTAHDMVLSLQEPIAAKYHTFAFDRPGHGLSTRQRMSGSPQAQAAELIQGIRALRLSRPIIVGHPSARPSPYSWHWIFPKK